MVGREINMSMMQLHANIEVCNQGQSLVLGLATRPLPIKEGIPGGPRLQFYPALSASMIPF
jgi:hypothetical protein